jgi:hypothetical protein
MIKELVYLIASFSPCPALNTGTFFAAIFSAAPVYGRDDTQNDQHGNDLDHVETTAVTQFTFEDLSSLYHTGINSTFCTV